MAKFVPLIKALLAICFWGASFVATKAVLREVSPITLIVLRFGLGVLVLALVVWRGNTFAFIRGRQLLYLCLLALIGIFVHQLLQANALLYTTAINTGWLIALTPIFITALARVWLRERFSGGKIGGTILAFGGALLVISQGRLSLSLFALPSTFGDLLIFISAITWALFSVGSKEMFKRYPARLVVAYVEIIGWLFLLPLFVQNASWREVGELTLPGWGSIGFLGILCSGVAYILWYDALEAREASQIGAFLYIEPLVTLATAHLLLHEEISAITIIGGLLILTGVYLVNRPSSK